MNSHELKDDILTYTMNTMTLDVYEEMNGLFEENELKGFIFVIPDKKALVSPEFWTLSNLPHIIWNEIAFMFKQTTPRTMVVVIDDDVLHMIHGALTSFIYDIFGVKAHFLRMGQIDTAPTFF